MSLNSSVQRLNTKNYHKKITNDYFVFLRKKTTFCVKTSQKIILDSLCPEFTYVSMCDNIELNVKLR